MVGAERTCDAGTWCRRRCHGVPVGGAGGDGEAGVLQAGAHVDRVAVVDVAGAGAALDGLVGADTEQRDIGRRGVGGRGDRQGVVVVLQQHHALGRGRLGQLRIGELEGARVRVGGGCRGREGPRQHERRRRP